MKFKKNCEYFNGSDRIESHAVFEEGEPFYFIHFSSFFTSGYRKSCMNGATQKQMFLAVLTYY